MADNITVTQGSGTSIATEDVSGVQHQKVKVEFGVDGVATMVSDSNPLPVAATIDTTGLATAANQQTNALTDAELRATPVPVSATIDTTGLATDATDTNTATIAGDTTSIDAKTPSLGQALAAASVPVVLTAAQVSTLTPPAAITNFANETGGNLAAIKAKTDNIPAQGQALASASLPVVLTAAQITTLTPPAAITGFSTETTLASIKNTDGIKKITDALPTGTNSIGKISDITTSVTPGTAAGNLGKAEDAGHTTGDVGVMMLGVRNEGHDDFSGTDKDYVPFATDATGDVYVNFRHPLTAGTAIIGKMGIDQTTPGTTNKVSVGSDVVHTIVDSGAITTSGTVTATLAAETTKVIGTVNVAASQTIGLAAGTAGIGKLTTNSGVTIGAVEIVAAQTLATVTTVGTLTGGGIAHDGVDSGNPLKVGGRARTSEIAAVANDDRTDFVATTTGKQIVETHTNPENIVAGVTAAMTGTTSTSLVAAPAGSLRNYITTITVSNSHATVGTDVEIQDGSGGTTIWVIPAAAVYGGGVVPFDPPLRQPTAATALYVKNTTTGASTRVSANGYKAL
jgi:hypothetical protein